MRLAVVILAVLLAGAATAAPAGAPNVLVSIKPLHSIAAAVMGDAGAPALLLAGGASPHSYALKPSDAEKIASAGVIFWVGPVLETFLTRPLATLGGRARIVALADAAGVVRLPARKGGLWQGSGNEATESATAIDGHIWLDPLNAAAIARVMAGTLAAADPPRAASYAANARAFADRMARLDAELARNLAPLRRRPYIVFHDAYRYFENRYRLMPLGAVTAASDRPVGAERLAALRRKIESTPGICLFAPAQFTPKLVTRLTEGTDARVAALDDLGADIPPGPALYETLLRRMAGALETCLVH